MEDYLGYELTQLVDMLAERTATYTQMMADGFSNGEEFAQIGQEIIIIQRTILKKMGVEGTEGNAELR